MATALYRLGRFAFRRRGLVVLVVAALLALLAAGSGAIAKPTNDTFTIPGTQSQQAMDLLSTRMPEAGASGASANVVFMAAPGTTLTMPTAQRTITATLGRLRALPHVLAVTDPFTTGPVSPDRTTAMATVRYAVASTDLTDADRAALLGTAPTSNEVHVAFRGDAVTAKPNVGGREGIGVLVAALVLFLTFGSAIAAGVPLLTALIGVGIGILGIHIASGIVTINSTTPTLAIMVGLAVGIDYALFITSRYRHELFEGRTPEEAAGRALGTAGSAVVFAGSTVVIALAALSVAGIPFLTTMGIAAAATVAVAVIVANTLLPAILGFLGPRVLARKGRGARDTEHDNGSAPLGERWARFVTRHRWAFVVGIIAVISLSAAPARDLQLALPSDATASVGSTQRIAYDAIARAFGPGVNGPLLVAMDLRGTKDATAAATSVATQLAHLPGVAHVTPPTLNRAGDMAILTVIPTTGPTDAATETLVQAIRGDAAPLRSTTGAQVAVTGQTAIQIDVSQKLHDALLPYLAVIIGIAFLLLMLVFRSLLVPLKAVLGFLLSVGAAFGAVVAVFQWGNLGGLFGIDTPSPIVSFLPIFLIGSLFGLAMDYEVFLVTRMREEHVHGASAPESIAVGFRHGARVVTAAAVIMVSVFGAFMTGGDPIIRSIGFGLAFGVFVDAFIVRMTLVPAVMSLLGDRAWWYPRWMDRITPDVDVEGARLARHLAAEPAPQH